MTKLTLYTTSACHLCEQAQVLIQALLETYALSLHLVDIAESEALMEKYGIRIPVLELAGSNKDLSWPFDQQMFIEYVEGEISIEREGR